MIKFTLADDGKTIDVPEGSFVVSLEGNPTTGYIWEIDSIIGESVVGEIEIVPHQPMTIGSGADFVATMRTVSKGVSRLKFVYRRPWDINDIARRFEVAVNIE